MSWYLERKNEKKRRDQFTEAAALARTKGLDEIGDAHPGGLSFLLIMFVPLIGDRLLLYIMMTDKPANALEIMSGDL